MHRAAPILKRGACASCHRPPREKNRWSESSFEIVEFVLQLLDRQGGVRPGAVVGMHHVTLYDLQIAASETGAGLPVRVKQDWMLPGSTTLTQEVKPGQQTLEIKLP